MGFAKEKFSQYDAGLPEADKLSMQFSGQASLEEAELLKQQIELEEKSVMKRWTNGPHKFCSLSLVDTLKKLIALSQTIEADHLRTATKISDKRYWCIKVRALSE